METSVGIFVAFLGLAASTVQSAPAQEYFSQHYKDAQRQENETQSDAMLTSRNTTTGSNISRGQLIGIVVGVVVAALIVTVSCAVMAGLSNSWATFFQCFCSCCQLCLEIAEAVDCAPLDCDAMLDCACDAMRRDALSFSREPLSQFFRYESAAFSLSCDLQEDAAAWTIKRNTSKQINSLCPAYTAGRNDSACLLTELYEMDSGVYWCESEAGKISNTINITVTERGTLSGNISSAFYKDELLIGESVRGSITLQRVSKSDQGLYKCHVSGVGESPDSFLTVRGFPESPPSLPGNIALLVMVTGVSLFLVMLLCLWRNHPDNYDSSVVIYSGEINRQTQRATDDLQRGRHSALVTVVVYRPAHGPALKPALKPARVWTYKAYREYRKKQQIFSSLHNKSATLSPANDYN
ncbi:uncharacterized protein LOC129376493 [Poeciliopsis prolifica]|uniref:uncharacterized protein LOC129376493 n=1 Tax=Poeciliopsis prolifica TaxID=188132 RepID=UPI0024143C30|nr:uncharacterized protein LOC129376493 [Poeciliopsis prolifica]